MHISDGKLKAYFDHELSSSEQEYVQDHVDSCHNCQLALSKHTSRTGHVQTLLSEITTHKENKAKSTTAARRQLEMRITTQENKNMFAKVFSRNYRLAWIVVGIVVILVAAIAFPPVQAIANSFLGLFRVQKFTVVSVDPSNLQGRLESANQLEFMFSEDVTVDEKGEPQEVDSSSEASALAGIPVRLPAGMNNDPRLMVVPGAKANFVVNLEHVRAVLNEIDLPDISLPANLDGATVSVDIPTSVSAEYGECEYDPMDPPRREYDPDDPDQMPRPLCTTFVQAKSPTISAPPGLDIGQIGNAFLQVIGMSPEEADHFAQNIDWTTTFVIPIPQNGTTYQEMPVDGVIGTLILQEYKDQGTQFALLWVKEGIVYALAGPGSATTAARIASNLK